ncbi:ABC transporter permease [Mycolicibacterium baixiangningiae]|uniref:ABC transporter permease n=1 Tax=Mycolicibacterium baixiangningiae TaxID=2761578 RepID=UPI0018D0D476|nr:ABC transporter permease [Mycolicibacterium baixiangningiae]
MSGRRIVGIVLLTFIFGMAFVGPFVSPHSPTEVLGAPYSSSIGLFGLDGLGRDVFSRLLHGGATLVISGLGVAIAAYLLAAPVGMFMALRGGRPEQGLTWLNDVLLAFPPILLLLLLATASGKGLMVVLVAVVIGNFPQVCRLARAAASNVAQASFIDASRLRGENMAAIVRRDILPNILPTLAADFGTRIASSIMLIAGATFLGLGEMPPSSNWALMVSENRVGMPAQPLATLAPAILIGLFIFGINLAGDRATGAAPRTSRLVHAVRTALAGRATA